ncbi:hypothetical protein [Silvibacterium sp.]|uniref:hypothetical protein n=1 Tax=Silvibacterium sp. TaxID=1964179 RepID=UPI0039E55051
MFSVRWKTPQTAGLQKTRLRAGGVMLAAMLVLTVGLSGCHKNDAAKSSPAQPTGAAQDSVAQQEASNTLATPGQNAAPAAQAGQPAPAASAAPAQPVPAPPAASAAAPSPAPANPAVAQQQAPPPPAPAPVPVVSVAAGTPLRIRLDQTIDVKHAHAGDHFHGVIAEPVIVDGATLIPTGSLASGEILEAHRRGHFKGRSVLELTLVGIDVNGHHYRIATATDVRTKKGKGKRSAAFIGGGAGLGMLVGGVATGGVGLLVGGLAGGGAGTLGAAFTGNRDIKIPAETVMTFRLAHSIQLQ